MSNRHVTKVTRPSAVNTSSSTQPMIRVRAADGSMSTPGSDGSGVSRDRCCCRCVVSATMAPIVAASVVSTSMVAVIVGRLDRIEGCRRRCRNIGKVDATVVGVNVGVAGGAAGTADRGAGCLDGDRLEPAVVDLRLHVDANDADDAADDQRAEQDRQGKPHNIHTVHLRWPAREAHMRTFSSRGTPASTTSSCRSEGFLTQVHDGQVDALDDLAFGG